MLLDHSWAEYSVVVRSIITNKPSQQHLSSCQRERDLREKRPWKKTWLIIVSCLIHQPYPIVCQRKWQQRAALSPLRLLFQVSEVLTRLKEFQRLQKLGVTRWNETDSAGEMGRAISVVMCSAKVALKPVRCLYFCWGEVTGFATQLHNPVLAMQGKKASLLTYVKKMHTFSAVTACLQPSRSNFRGR